MNGRDPRRDDVDARLLAVRRALRERHAALEPDAHFVDRVIARLPREQGFSFDWAVRRVLPVSLAVALALTIAVVFTTAPARRAAASTPVASGANAPSSQTGSDPLEWLLEDRQEVR